MKKAFFFILLPALFLSLAKEVNAQNKCGVNVGPNYGQVGQVASLTKQGGWVVALGTPGDCDGLSSLFGQGLNVVIRAYNGGRPFTNDQALGWVATLGKMDTKGQKIYFMPWNEPNNSEEGGGPNAGATVYQYTQFLKNQLQEAGLLGSKVVLLSPMVDKTNPSFIDGSFFTGVGKSNFYSVFDGSSINEYDHLKNGEACSSGVLPEQNNCQYDQIGINPPYYALEAGVAGTCSGYPCYKDHELKTMLDRSWQKWHTDPNFKMFAIFSYDPISSSETYRSWNIFSAPQVKSFYSGNCQSGSVISGSPDQAKFDSWLKKHSSQLISCGGCGYATSKEFCQATGIPTKKPVILNLQNGAACVDFAVDYHNTTETKTATETADQSDSQVQGNTIFTDTLSKMISGEIKLTQENIPDFSVMERTLSSSLPKLLPNELQPDFYIEGRPLKTEAKHYVFGTSIDSTTQVTTTSEIETPSTKITLPNWWTRLIGTSKIHCGIMGSCVAPENLHIKVQQPPIQTLPPTSSCSVGEDPGQQSVDQIENASNGFSLSSLFKVIKETLESLIKTTETTSLLTKTRFPVPGSITVATQADYARSFIPSEFLPEGLNAPLGGDSKYAVTIINDSQEVNNQTNYQSLGLTRLQHCLHLCSLYPYGTNITAIDKICPSCDPADYPLGNIDDIPLDQSMCQRDSSNACDYVVPGESPRCDGDPVCESGKCYPLMYRQAQDYTNNGCPVPYGAGNCNDPAICKSAVFAKNPDGGFGACQYQNPNVCVRTDRELVGSCAALCNRACCEYQ
ncbi:MAG: hypothetical protein ACOX50_02035 [Patescibacteria group bacterium]|jgi:hypothetical protein